MRVRGKDGVRPALAKLVEGWAAPFMTWGRLEDERDGEAGGAAVKSSTLGLSPGFEMSVGGVRLELSGKVPTQNRNLGIISK